MTIENLECAKCGATVYVEDGLELPKNEPVYCHICEIELLRVMLKRLKEEYKLSDIWADEEQGEVWDKL